MIYRIYSSLPKFKTLDFKSGLNVLLAEKTADSGSGLTRNRAGKSSMVETIHFLTGGTVSEKSPYSSKDLAGATFGMEFDMGGKRISVEREVKKRAKFKVDGNAISGEELRQRLGAAFFGLENDADEGGTEPSFRSMFAYFVRRQASNAFTEPFKQAVMQGTGDYQLALSYLLGLDWQIAREWQIVREREKTLDELKKAAGAGAFGSIIGTAADLRTQHTIADARLKRLKEALAAFHVLPEYRELETEADQLRAKFSELSNQNAIDTAAIRHIDAALNTEEEPAAESFDELYRDAAVVLPELVKRRYDEVREFHASVIRNRRDYLGGERQLAEERINQRAPELTTLDRRLSEIMGILKGHGALDQFSKLQAEMGKVASEVESLYQRYQAAEKLEGSKAELELERNRLLLRLNRDFSEQESRIAAAILAYESISQRLYEDAGQMIIEATNNGPIFRFPIQGSRSKGISNMKIFCFDLMLMQRMHERAMGPGFLVHDSHLFDGVDGQQIISGLKAAAELSATSNFQYIVTLNQDDAFKEKLENFDLNQFVLPVRLSDAKEDGGLYGFRFD
jgi:uncharacterized protein YydD (DUF2326 family)